MLTGNWGRGGAEPTASLAGPMRTYQRKRVYYPHSALAMPPTTTRWAPLDSVGGVEGRAGTKAGASQGEVSKGE